MESRVVEKERKPSKEENDFLFLKKENHLWRGSHDSTLGKKIIFLGRRDGFCGERKARVLVVEEIISLGERVIYRVKIRMNTLFFTFFFFFFFQPSSADL